MNKMIIPCVACGHKSRDHNRSIKQADGSYNGRCRAENCTCKLYKKPIGEMKLEQTG